MREAYRLEDNGDTSPVRQSFIDTVNAWLAGARFQDIALRSTLPLDDLLGVHGRVVSLVLQTLVEQGIALLAKLLESQERTLAPAVVQFPELRACVGQVVDGAGGLPAAMRHSAEDILAKLDAVAREGNWPTFDGGLGVFEYHAMRLVAVRERGGDEDWGLAYSKRPVRHARAA